MIKPLRTSKNFYQEHKEYSKIRQMDIFNRNINVLNESIQATA